MSNNYQENISFQDFVEIGLPIFDSEDVTNSLISIYLSMMSNGWAGAYSGVPLPLPMLGNFYHAGLWLSCLKRVAISGQIDFRSDGVSEIAAIPIGGSRVGFEFVSVQKVARLPRGFCALPGSSSYFWAGETQRGNGERTFRRMEMDPLLFDATYFSLVGDRILPTKHKDWPNGAPAASLAIRVAAALQTVADFKTMWVVKTSELTTTSIETPLRLGVDSEIIKSLFYSRQLPITESGRRRPILHWVRAHQRRLADGIDIDVTKHLRGIDRFEMDGFGFDIVQPRRPEKAAA